MRWIGEPEFSWSDLRAILRKLSRDPESEYARSIDPDGYVWVDPTMQLLAEVANIMSDLRLFSIIDRTPDGAIDPQYLARFGPHRPGADGPDQESESLAEEAHPERRGRRSVEEQKAIAERARRRAAGLD